MGEGINIRTSINIDFTVNEEIETAFRLKRVTDDTEIIKEDAFGQMIEERWKLEKALQDKGITFDELLKSIK